MGHTRPERRRKLWNSMGAILCPGCQPPAFDLWDLRGCVIDYAEFRFELSLVRRHIVFSDRRWQMGYCSQRVCRNRASDQHDELLSEGEPRPEYRCPM